jgi:NAD(P)-dependent dehydrogenase (short-subunit alcohol dehydrogenase family)
MRRAGEVAGQVIVITGAARGIGALTARRLAARGARVALLGLEPGELAHVCAACGPAARWWEVDVTDEQALADAADEIQAAYGRVDAVVANAGIAIGGPFRYSDAHSFTRVIEVNLLGSVATARAFLPALLDSQGYLLQVASLAAITPAPLMAAYCASKSGVEAFANAVRAEVAQHGMGVGVAYLSWTETDMVRGADEHPVLRGMRAALPLLAGRVYPPESAADALVRGIGRRASRVYGQWWLAPVQLTRGVLALCPARFAAAQMPSAESQWLASGAVSDPVGAGGAADSRARSAPGPGRPRP